MTLAEMQATLYDSLSFDTATGPSAIVIARLLRYINLAYREVMRKKNIGSRLRRAPLTMVTVANAPFAVLPQAMTSIHVVVDRTNNRVLDELTLPSARLRDPGLLFSTGTPYGYVPYRYQDCVSADPSAAGQLTVLSDSALDVGTAYVETIKTGGYQQVGSVTMTGVTPASIGTATTIRVEKFYLSAAALGTVSLKDGAGNVIAVIPIGRTRAVYTRLLIVDVPSSALTLYVDGELKIFDLANPNDEPLLPEDFHELLVYGAITREATKRTQVELLRENKSLHRAMLAELQAYVQKPSGTRVSGGRTPQFSQLGPFFPAGT